MADGAEPELQLPENDGFYIFSWKTNHLDNHLAVKLLLRHR
jgi:hypothetical protein